VIKQMWQCKENTFTYSTVLGDIS